MMGHRANAMHCLALLLLLLAGRAVSANSPLDLVLVLDNSGSMKGNDAGFLIKPAVTAFLDGLREQARVAMIVFDHRVEMTTPPPEPAGGSLPVPQLKALMADPRVPMAAGLLGLLILVSVVYLLLRRRSPD